MKIIKYKYCILCLLFILMNMLPSCRRFLEVPANKSKILSDKVFSDDGNATSALLGIYYKMQQSGFAGGGIGISFLTGLSSDELHNILQDGLIIPFENNTIQTNDGLIATVWREAYQIIYQANDVLEELERSAGITDGVKTQLKAEALFARSFCYFYLVNLFGDVPLILNADYIENSLKSRTASEEVYNQIVTDLLKSQETIQEAYTEPDRVRANKATVTALLARVYLYMGNLENAQLQSTNLIDDADYSIIPDIDQIFLKSSGETIWQLASEEGYNSKEITAFSLLYGTSSYSGSELRPGLLNSFEPGDLRKASWVGIYSDPNTSDVYYYSSKYKAEYFGPTTEYFIVFRLAEQYLIRAEAAAKQDNLEQAIMDIDKIRERAGLDLIQDTNPSISKEDLLDLIAHERRIEFFTEWGHRWFDLKRSNTATAVLQPLKPEWSANDTLYPIPQNEFQKNPNLGEQNTGY